MNIEQFRLYCLAKKMVTEEFPFDQHTLVFKVAGKMFALTGLNEDFRVNLKCNPEKAIELREQYEAVIPGYHMNKQHWNTVIMDDSIPDHGIKEMIDHSYSLVVDGLSKKMRESIQLGRD